MNKFKRGDFVFSVERKYSITIYRHFFVGLVTSTSGRHGIRVLPIYSISHDPVSQALFHPDRVSRKKKKAFDSYINPLLQEMLSPASSPQTVRQASSLLEQSNVFTDYGVESAYFEKLTFENLHSSFDGMLQLRIACRHESHPHPIYGTDYKKIKEEFITEVSHFLKYSSPLSQFSSLEIISEIDW